MKTRSALSAAVSVLATPFLWGQAEFRGEPVPTRGAATTGILVKFRNLADALHFDAAGDRADRLRPELASVLSRHQMSKGKRLFPRTRFRGLERVVQLTPAQPLDQPDRLAEVLATLRAQPDVEYAEPNVEVHAFGVPPNDPYYSSSGSWGQSFADLWGLSQIHVAPAWDRTQGNGVVVAVVDTGIDFTHVDLSANVWLNPGETGLDAGGRDRRSNGVDDDGNGFVDDWRGWNFSGFGTGSNDPTDDNGHGTHVAGTIAAVANNAVGIVGVAPQSRVMAVKALDNFGNGSVAGISNAILYAANAGARVINASLGARGDTPQTLVDAIAYAHDVKGAVLVAAAGNDNGNVGTFAQGIFPANIADAVAVSASDHLDQKASFSSFGAKIDVAAPGGGDTDPGVPYAPQRSILSLKSRVGVSAILDPGLFVGTDYLRQAGTSMAAPHVAGVAALVAALHPDYSPEQVRQAVRKGAEDVGSAGFDLFSGYGRLNADGATAETGVLAARLTAYVAPFAAGTAVGLRGSVGGAGLVDWTLEYGRGALPTAWTAIASGTNTVNKGLLATWSTGDAFDGDNVVRLTARNTDGRTYEDRLPVVVDSVVIASVRRPAHTVELYGTLTPAGFDGYAISVTGLRTGAVSNPNITLPNGGTQPVGNGLLGSWDTTGAPTDYYRVCVFSTHSTFATECVEVLVDPDLHPGWPQDFTAEGLLPGVGAALTDHLTAADIDGDGGKELLVAYGKVVHVFRHDGTELPGWPQFPDLPGSAIFQKGPTVGDLTGDGVPEIAAVQNFSTVFVWDAQGRLLPGWPRALFGSGSAALVIDDLNGDGRNELIAAGSEIGSTWIVAMDVNGNVLPGWPRDPGWSYSQSLSVGDVDGDGAKEVVVQAVRVPNPIVVYRADGTLQPGWPRDGNPGATNVTFSYPALGDLDGDGAMEIVVGANDGNVYAFKGDGTLAPGWPQPAVAAANSPAIGDIDGDGRPEVVVGTSYTPALIDYLYAWHGDGTLLPGWPVASGLGVPVSQFGYGVPILADMDGDGRADVVASSDAGSNQLDAFRFDGTAVAGFPRLSKPPGNWGTVGPVAADLDGDGRRELAWLNRLSLVVWDLGAATSTPAPWPMFRADAGHTGRIIDGRPTVELTSPVAATMFSPPATIRLAATAADADGRITNVEFFQGTTKVGEDTTPPYEFLWTNVGSGAYSLTARAQDDSGRSTTSRPVVVIVNAPPTVSLTTPANGAQFAGPATIHLTATAADADGSVVQVEFFTNGDSLGVVTSSPYELTWSNVDPGPFTLTSRATDNRGATTLSAPVSVTVLPSLTLLADAYVRGGPDSNRNFGGSPNLVVKRDPKASDTRWTYLKFDLPPMPTAQSARLWLFGRLSATTGTPIQTAVYPVANTTWQETGLTWNNKPPSGTTALAVTTLANSTSPQWYEWDVTAYVRQQQIAQRSALAFALKNLANSVPFVVFDSKESNGRAAQLIVIPTP